jgi:hypothetical protein
LGTAFFNWRIFSKKTKLITTNLKKKVILYVFNFHKLCTLYLVYSHIWLNLPRDGRQYSCIVLLMIAMLATNKTLYKKKKHYSGEAGGWHLVSLVHMMADLHV